MVGKQVSENHSQFTLQIPWEPKIHQNALSHTVSKINVFLHLTQKFKMAAKMARNIFWEKLPDVSANTLGVKNFVSAIFNIFHFHHLGKSWHLVNH